MKRILEKVVNATSLSKLLSLRQIGDGIAGEIFETHIFNELEKDWVVRHIGIDKKKADIVIDGVEYSCKVKGKNEKPTKVHHTGFDIPNVKKMNNEDIKKLIFSTVSKIRFMFLVQSDEESFVSICNIDVFLNKIRNGNFKVKKNRSSVTIDADGQQINITKAAVFLNKACFYELEKKEFKYTEYCPYKIIKEFLSR